ncbi:hypothetical protein Bca52824_071753 [Brassica carinata]|uniref:Uncharacterized protein n=1 Tax=Brassica carinata TaxID=52824 RepID=A0A8X7U4B4_BRACI|nr:hypothetical protein Bca52824_071753 [Brassica carinata]
MAALTTVVACSCPALSYMVSSTLFTWRTCRGRLGRGQCIPGPFGTSILGGLVLSPLLLESRFLFSGILDEFMDITVVPHVAAVPQFYPHSFKEPAD